MKGVEFPLYITKRQGVEQKFDLSDPAERAKYFEAKVGEELKKLRAYLADPESREFVAFLLGKKNSGKGTYSKLFMEAIGLAAKDRVGHLSVGDLVRDIHRIVESKEGYDDLKKFLAENFRGFHSLEEIDDIILGRSQSTLVSTELILALVRFEISRRSKQAIFIDGFPRGLDQINYSLFLKEIIGYQGHPDFFVFIDVPEAVIDERIKYRVICPICKTPRNTRLLATRDVGWDEGKQEFYLMCDNPECNKARMVPKEGDELGIEPIRKRLETDDQIIKQLMGLEGVPKVYLRNSVPVDKAADTVDGYEITPGYSYERDIATGQVEVIESPWTIKDDNGIDSYSLMPPAVVVGLIKQVSDVLGL